MGLYVRVGVVVAVCRKKKNKVPKYSQARGWWLLKKSVKRGNGVVYTVLRMTRPVMGIAEGEGADEAGLLGKQFFVWCVTVFLIKRGINGFNMIFDLR